MRPRRAITTFVLHLIVGTAVAFAVAVGCAAWPASLHSLNGGAVGIPSRALIPASDQQSRPHRMWIIRDGGAATNISEGNLEFRTHRARLQLGLPLAAEEPESSMWFVAITSSLGREAEACGVRFDGAPAGEESHTLISLSVGWPRPCLMDRHELALLALTGSTRPLPDSLALPHWLNLNTDSLDVVGPLLPLNIIPSGLAINAGFYGLISFTVTRGLRLARRAARRRRYQCPDCGYDRRGLAAGAPCPECGAREGARPDTGLG